VGIAEVPKKHQHARQTRDTKYTVRRGDTLSTIARRHHVRMSELVALNGLKSRNRIRVGQKLRLPSNAGATRSSTRKAAYKPAPSRTAARSTPPAELPASGYYKVRRGDNLTRIAEKFGLTMTELVSMNRLKSRNRIAIGQRLRVAHKKVASSSSSSSSKASTKPTDTAHPDAAASLSPARKDLTPSSSDLAYSGSPKALIGEERTADAGTATHPASDIGQSSSGVSVDLSDESAIEPSPGLLADPSDYTVASNGTIHVQPNETLGHYAEWLGLRASRLRSINDLSYGEPLVVEQKLRLDFSNTSPEDFERVRIEYHRALQEEFFTHWEIEGTRVHRVGPGDSLWVLSKRRFDVPIWLLRQYNPDIDLNALSTGTRLTIPRLRERHRESKVQRSAAS